MAMSKRYRYTADCVRGTTIIQIILRTPKVGHQQPLPAIKAGGEGYLGYTPRPDWIRSAALFYVVPVATNVKTIIHMGLRAVLGCSTASSRRYDSV
eukprot:986068-Pleurochrysis_carterae.AAC.7